MQHTAESVGLHGPARLCAAERDPLTKSQLARLWTFRARAAELDRDPNVHRDAPAGPLACPAVESARQDPRLPEKILLPYEHCALKMRLVHLHMNTPPKKFYSRSTLKHMIGANPRPTRHHLACRPPNHFGGRLQNLAPGGDYTPGAFLRTIS